MSVGVIALSAGRACCSVNHGCETQSQQACARHVACARGGSVPVAAAQPRLSSVAPLCHGWPAAPASRRRRRSARGSIGCVLVCCKGAPQADDGHRRLGHAPQPHPSQIPWRRSLHARHSVSDVCAGRCQEGVEATQAGPLNDAPATNRSPSPQAASRPGPMSACRCTASASWDDMQG